MTRMREMAAVEESEHKQTRTKIRELRSISIITVGTQITGLKNNKLIGSTVLCELKI